MALIKLAFVLREQSRESDAAALHEESFALLDELVREAPRDGEIAGMWIATLAHGAVEDWEAGRVEGVGERLELAESEARALLERDPYHGTPMFAQVLDWRAWWCLKNGRPDTAGALYQEALEHLETALAADEHNQRMLYLASKIAFNLAMRANGAGRYEEAGTFLERAWQHIDWVADAFPEIARYEEHRNRVGSRLPAVAERGEGASDE